jgi:hypothetical protein
MAASADASGAVVVFQVGGGAIYHCRKDSYSYSLFSRPRPWYHWSDCWCCGVAARRNKEISSVSADFSDSIDPGDFGTGIWSFDEMVLLAGIAGTRRLEPGFVGTTATLLVCAPRRLLNRHVAASPSAVVDGGGWVDGKRHLTGSGAAAAAAAMLFPVMLFSLLLVVAARCNSIRWLRTRYRW